MKNLALFSVLTVLLISCNKESHFNDGTTINGAIVPSDIREYQVPSNFDYRTSMDIKTDISVKGLDNSPLGGIRIDFYTKDPFQGGELFASGFTSNDGILHTDIKIPSYLKEIYVQCNYKGFANSKVVQASDQLSINFGGTPAPRQFKKGKTSGSQSLIPAGGNVYYMGSAGSLGLPDYLENPGDQIDQVFLDDINTSLPSNQNVSIHNPSYLSNANEFEIVIDQISDVWVTFVAEGAGYKNALGYYVYDSNNPPSSASQIDSIKIIFRNTSLAGSGGLLNAGDKVHLGRFPAGKTISWVLFQNAYNSSSNTVNINAQRIYSKADFNPEPIVSDRQHNVQLVDNARQLILNGFEDILRNQSNCDHDFEDLLYYVTSNPWTAIETGNIPPVTPSADSDGDGVNDQVDDYPNDPNRALDVNYMGNIGFEDLWPAQGDYDFNDLVMGYDIDHVMNASNEVVDIKADWTIRAVGAGFNNGFGFEFQNVLPSAVQSLTGNSLKEGIISTNANGTESGQTNATVIAFDNVFNEIQHVGGPFINTIKTDPYANEVTMNIVLSFNSPQPLNDVGLPPYNSFIFVNGDRGKEVHLADHSPTDLANTAYFGTADDDSNINQERFYKTSNNLPWGLHIYGNYDYPIEYEPINNAYTKFGSWAQSSGTTFEDWYLDQSGYRNSALIY